MCMVDKESNQEQRQDHIQDGQQILAKDAHLRTANHTYVQGSHLDRQRKWGHIMVGYHTTGNEKCTACVQSIRG